MRQHGLEGGDGVFDGGGVDDHSRVEGIDFGEVGETPDIVGETQLFGVGVVDGDLVVEGQQVTEERAHLAGSEDEDFHIIENL